MTPKKLLLLLSFVFSIAACQTFAQKADELPDKNIKNIVKITMNLMMYPFWTRS